MQGIKSLLINVTENELKTQRLTKIIKWPWTEKFKVRVIGKVAVQEILPRSIPMQGIKSVLINVTENELKRKG